VLWHFWSDQLRPAQTGSDQLRRAEGKFQHPTSAIQYPTCRELKRNAKPFKVNIGPADHDHKADNQPSRIRDRLRPVAASKRIEISQKDGVKKMRRIRSYDPQVQVAKRGIKSAFYKCGSCSSLAERCRCKWLWLQRCSGI
jgi:hypothetical protein